MAEQNPYLALVNKTNHYNESMSEGLTMLKVRDTDGATFVEKETFLAFKQLSEFMQKKYGIALFLTSAGRTIQTQQKVLNDFIAEMGEEEALKTVALPGTSEHHTGLALDVKPEIAHSTPVQAVIDKLPLPEKIAYLKQPTREQKAEMYALLHHNLAKFGFIQRYTKEKQDITGYKPEPWHIRFVGKEHAKAIAESGMCLEEYIQSLELEQNEPGT